MAQTEARVEYGMDMEQVVSILGEPTEKRPLRFGNELLSTWVYGNGVKPSYVWFGENGKVKITSLA